MTRKHIEFIQSQNIQPQDWEIEGLPTGANTRILSIDSETGDSSEWLAGTMIGWSIPVTSPVI